MAARARRPRASGTSSLLLSSSPGDERRVATYRSTAHSESSRTRFTSLAVGKGALPSPRPRSTRADPNPRQSPDRTPCPLRPLAAPLELVCLDGVASRHAPSNHSVRRRSGVALRCCGSRRPARKAAVLDPAEPGSTRSCRLEGRVACSDAFSREVRARPSSVAGSRGGQQRGREGSELASGSSASSLSPFSSSLELAAGLGGANPSAACSGALPRCVVTSRRPRRNASLPGPFVSRTWSRSCPIVHGSTAPSGLHCTSEDMSCPDPPLFAVVVARSSRAVRHSWGPRSLTQFSRPRAGRRPRSSFLYSYATASSALSLTR